MHNQEAQQSPGAKPGFFYGYVVVAATFFIMVVAFGMYDAFGVFFKPVLTEFGWTSTMTSGAVSLSMIIHGFLAIAMGGLNDRFGPRIVLTFCGFLLGLGYLLMSQVSTVWQLYLFYGVILGTGMSGVFIPLVSTVARWFVAKRNMMTGIVVAGIGAGTLIAAPVVNWLISIYDWRRSYIILGTIVLAAVVSAAQLLKRDPTQVGQVPYGENRGAEHGAQLETEAFSFREAVHTKQFWIVFSIFFCFGFCLFAILVHIVPHSIELGLSATSAANILATIGGLSIIGKVVLGGVADRIGNRWAFAIGFILMSAALFWLVAATEAWVLYLFAVVFGFAYGGCATSESPIVAVLFGLDSHGLILGVIDVGFSIGAAVGPLLAGYIFDVTDGYQLAFLVCAGIGVIGIILSALLTPIRQNGWIKRI